MGFAYRNWLIKLALPVAALLPAVAGATIDSITSGDVVMGNRLNNLIVNGSFEADWGSAANGSFWATGTNLSPTMSLTGWNATGNVGSYAVWGNDNIGPNWTIKGSDVLPDGQAGLYFGAFIMQSLGQQPTFHTDGTVTFSGNPNIVPDPNDGPVTLSQTLSGLNTSQQYLLDFWASGEDASFAVWQDGFFGLDITGENTMYFAAPGGQSGLGASQRYYILFHPSASTVTLTFTNWGHFTDSFGFHSEICLDDVIVNPTPEPVTLFGLGAPAAFLALRRRRARQA